MAIDRQFPFTGAVPNEAQQYEVSSPQQPSLVDQHLSDEMRAFIEWSKAVDAQRANNPVYQKQIKANQTPFWRNLGHFEVDDLFDFKDKIFADYVYRPLNRFFRPRVHDGFSLGTFLKERIDILTTPRPVENRERNNMVEGMLLALLDAKDRTTSNIELLISGTVGYLGDRASVITSSVLENTARTFERIYTPVLSTLEWARVEVVDRATNVKNFILSAEGREYAVTLTKALFAGFAGLGIYKFGSHILELQIQNYMQALVAGGGFLTSLLGARFSLQNNEFDLTQSRGRDLSNWIKDGRIFTEGRIARTIISGVLAASLLPLHFQAEGPAIPRMPLYTNELAIGEIPDTLNQALYKDIHEHPERAIVYLSRGYALIDGQTIPVDMSLLNLVSGDQVPLRFIDSNSGDLLFTAHKRIWDPNTVVSPEFLEILTNVESAPYSQYVAPAEWFANVLPRALQGTTSGGSTPEMGLVKLSTGIPGSESLLSGSEFSYIYQPELYSIDYLARLAASVYQGKVPNDLLQILEGTEMPSGQNISEVELAGWQGKINAAAMQLERIVVSQRLMSLYGQDAVLQAWAANLPLGAAPDTGMPIHGVGALGEVLFGKPESELNTAEKIIVARMIHEPGFYMSDIVAARQEGRTPAVIDAIAGWVDDSGYNQGLLDVMERKGQITHDEKNELLKQLSSIQWTLRTPDEFRNQFLSIENGISGEERIIAEEILGPSGYRFVIDGEQASRIISISPKEIVIGLDLNIGQATEIALPVLPEEVEGVEVNSTFGPATEQFIDANIVEHQITGHTYFTFTGPNGKPITEFTTGKARELRIVEYEGMPGITIAASGVLTGSTEIQRSQYDGTEGLLSSLPVQPGSTIKLIMWAIAVKEGVVKDFYKDQIFDHPARVRLALNDTRLVRNIGGGEWKFISPAQALVNSRNEPVLWAIQQVLYRNLPLDEGFKQDPKRMNYLGLEGENTAAKKEVIRRWNEVIQADMAKFGLVFCDIHGNPLTEPTGVEAIGTDVWIKDVNGKIAPLQAYADSFLAFADPKLIPEVAADAKLANAVRIVGGALIDPKLRSKTNMRWGNPDGGDRIILGGKGGTVQIGDGNTVATLGAFFSMSPEGIRAVVAYEAGSRNGQPLNLDYENKFAQVSAESAGVLQLARAVIIHSNSFDTRDWNDASQSKEKFDENLSSGNICVSALKSDTVVHAPYGSATIRLAKSQLVDLIGKPVNFRKGNNGLVQRQKVAWIDAEGKYFEGYIYTEGVSEDFFDTTLDTIKLQDQKLLAETQTAIQSAIYLKGEGQVSDLTHKNILIVGPNESSPALRWIYQGLKGTGELGRGPEVTEEILRQLGLPADTIILDQEQLKLYVDEAQYEIYKRTQYTPVVDGDRFKLKISFPEDMLYRTLENLSRQQRIQQVVAQFNESGINLQDLIWHNGELTNAGALLYSLSDEGINSTAGYKGGEATVILYPFDDASPMTKEWARLRKIGFAYRALLNGTATPEEKKQFVTLVRQLNTSPSASELQALGRSDTLAGVSGVSAKMRATIATTLRR